MNPDRGLPEIKGITCLRIEATPPSTAWLKSRRPASRALHDRTWGIRASIVDKVLRIEP